MSEGQIYPYLHELEESGSVTAEWQTNTGAAPRKVYQLTPEGRTQLSKHRADFKKFIAGVGSVLGADQSGMEAVNG